MSWALTSSSLPLALALALTLASPVSADTFADGSAPIFTPCTIGDERARLRAECAEVRVPLDPRVPDGDTLALALARLPARRDVPGNAPFTLIAGGPGQSAIAAWPTIARAFRHISATREVLLIDQRGTGSSTRLDCPEAADEAADNGTTDDPTNGATDSVDTSDSATARDPVTIRADALDCLRALPADPRLFTSSVAVRDLEHVRERLAIPRWHLYGVSYGTRVAQHYARRHPARVATLILDAVVPTDAPLGADVAAFAARALALLFARCADDPDCATRFTDIETRTLRWLDTLAERPRTVVHEAIVSGAERETRLDADRLATFLRLMLYDARTAALLPAMLHAAIEDDHLAPLARQARLRSESLGASIASGMHHTIVCSEDVPRLPDDAAERAARTWLGAALITSLRASCADWPVGLVDADLAEPLAVDVPTLLLSGEADPITPPSYGERVAATLPRARHLINPGQGHMQAPLGCVPLLMARFIDTGDPDGLDTGCLARLVPAPFFVDANGPMP